VAKRSTGWLETGRLHPAINVKISNVKRIFLFMFSLIEFKVIFLTGQNLGAETPAIRTQDFFPRDDISEN
jgi:hypothetical protein